MSTRDTFYITTPIYYVNDVPHIGHAYTTVAADVLARYWRLRGRDVFFLTGLDEHGQKVQQAAAKAGIDPQAHCDRLAPQFTNLWQRLNISHNAFIRTTDKPHQTVVQRYLQQLFDKQLIYKADYTGWYCTYDERFWTEKDVVGGLCPDCKRPIEQLSDIWTRVATPPCPPSTPAWAAPSAPAARKRCSSVLAWANACTTSPTSSVVASSNVSPSPVR